MKVRLNTSVRVALFKHVTLKTTGKVEVLIMQKILSHSNIYYTVFLDSNDSTHQLLMHRQC